MVGKTLEKESGNPLRYSSLESPVGRRAQAAVHGGTKIQTQLNSRRVQQRGVRLSGGGLGWLTLDRDTLAAVAGWPPQSGVPGGFHGLCPHDTKTAGYELRKKSVKESFPS